MICNTCNKEKATTEFYAYKTAKEHTQINCKICIDKIRVETTEKKCNQCSKTLSIKNFRYRNDRHAFSSACNTCISSGQKKHYTKNIVHIKERDKKYHLKNKEQRNKSCASYYENNKEKIKLRKKLYRERNKEKILADQRERYKNDPVLRLNSSLRRRVRNCVGSGKSCFDLLGCSISHLKNWFQFQCTYGLYRNLTLDNMGPVWEIDHMIPCASFDNAKIEQRKICFHWSNLAVLPGDINREKNDNIDIKRICIHNVLLEEFSKQFNNYELLEFTKLVFLSEALDSAVDGKPFKLHHVNSVGYGNNSKDETELKNSVEIGNPQPSL